MPDEFDGQQGDDEAPPVKLPPARSGARMMILTAALILVFLGFLWYATFVALQQRGPDRAVIDQESWGNGTIVIIVKEVRSDGEVTASSLTVNLTTSANVVLYEGALGNTSRLIGFNLTAAFVDRDHSQTLTTGDKITLTADPPAGIDNLQLSNFFLYSDGREWARLSLPP